jgi:hypothetical protein
MKTGTLGLAAAAAVAILLGLTSCIGIQSQIRIRGDGSGTLALSYRISQFVKDLDVGHETKRLPLPVSKEDFDRAVSGIQGLRLVRVEEREDEKDVNISAELEFDQVQALDELGRPGQMEFSLRAGNGSFTFTQLLYSGHDGEDISADTMQMIEAFFAGYDLVYTVEAPSPIKSHSLGTLSADGRSVTYQASVPELLKSRDKVALEIVW